MMQTTPFPNWLVDTAMPSLRDTEWRVLCVVARQTIGFRSAFGGRKQFDWISHDQLKAKTGRESEAVSRAVDGLVRLRMIEVRSAAGYVLVTPRERRLYRGRLLYSLCEPSFPQAFPRFSRKIENRKAKITKDSLYKR